MFNVILTLVFVMLFNRRLCAMWWAFYLLSELPDNDGLLYTPFYSVRFILYFFTIFTGWLLATSHHRWPFARLGDSAYPINHVAVSESSFGWRACENDDATLNLLEVYLLEFKNS